MGLYLCVSVIYAGIASERLHGSSCYTVFIKINVSPKVKNFVSNSGVRKFGHGTSNVAKG